MMKKIKFIFLSLISLFFLSCESVYLDLNNVHCEIDKRSYQKEESIKLTCYGNFKDHDDVGIVYIFLYVDKIINNEHESVSSTGFTIKTYGSFQDDSEHCYGEGYSAFIKNDEKMTDFNNSIVFCIHEPGNYELSVEFRGSTDNHPYGGIRRFTLPITITE